MHKTMIAALTLSFLLVPAAPSMAEQTALTPAQQTEIKNIIRNFLVEEEPEIIIKAAQTVQQREQVKQTQSAQEAVVKNKDKIYSDPDTQILGNAKGDVMVVEFFDYQCGYCKMAHPALKELMEKDKNVAFVAKEFPILGDGSLMASRAAIASIKQKKYDKFHNALMEFRGQLNESSIMEAATKSGLNADQLKKDMNDKRIDEIVAKNRALGAELGVRGTPFFIIGDEVRPGAMNADELNKAVANARSKKGKK